MWDVEVGPWCAGAEARKVGRQKETEATKSRNSVRWYLTVGENPETGQKQRAVTAWVAWNDDPEAQQRPRHKAVVIGPMFSFHLLQFGFILCFLAPSFFLLCFSLQALIFHKRGAQVLAASTSTSFLGVDVVCFFLDAIRIDAMQPSGPPRA